MAIVRQCPLRGTSLYMNCGFRILGLVVGLLCVRGLAKPVDDVRKSTWGDSSLRSPKQITLDDVDTAPGRYSLSDTQHPLAGETGSINDTLTMMLDTLGVMQSEYFVLWEGTWPTGIDWTNAVMGTQVSATLSTLSWTLDNVTAPLNATATTGCGSRDSEHFDTQILENLIEYYFDHTSAFWFGENVIALRLQAYDDMLWVVLEWLENLKFQGLHNGLHYSGCSSDDIRRQWHGTQFKEATAHRARIFYELAARGWDTTLCGGGMVWSPYLGPYKNAITNELFISASIGMYIYFPGDAIDFPIVATPETEGLVAKPHDPDHLNAAITAYDWLKGSNMLGINNLYADGFHIRGWSEDDPGTGNCDVLNTMVYTYNQGVILSGMRGLWLATGSKDYLEDGHELVKNVMKSTGWPRTSSGEWKGLGRGGVLEEACDSSGDCNQDGQTFKGIFFQHLSEFCRPLTPFEERFVSAPLDHLGLKERHKMFKQHQRKCSSYRAWIEHNAHAAYVTKNEEGKFGMWWGRENPDHTSDTEYTSALLPGAIDHQRLESADNCPHAHPESCPASVQQPDDTRGIPGDRRPSQLGRSEERRLPAERDYPELNHAREERSSRDVNDRGRGRTLETQAGALAVFRALYNWQTAPSLNGEDDE